MREAAVISPRTASKRRCRFLLALGCVAIGLAACGEGRAFVHCARIGTQSRHAIRMRPGISQRSPVSPRPLRVFPLADSSAQLAMLFLRSPPAAEAVFPVLLVALSIALPFSLLDLRKVGQQLRITDFLGAIMARLQQKEPLIDIRKRSANLVSSSDSQTVAMPLPGMDKPDLVSGLETGLDYIDAEALGRKTKVQEMFESVITDILHLSSVHSKREGAEKQMSLQAMEAVSFLGDDVLRLNAETKRNPSSIAGIDKFELESGISVLRDVVRRGGWSRLQRGRLVDITEVLVTLSASLEDEDENSLAARIRDILNEGDASDASLATVAQVARS